MRSYLRGRHRAEGFDFCDTTHCQDLRATAIVPAGREAAEATQGELLWFHGAPAATFYGKDCGGVTEAAEAVWPDLKAPYLIRQTDPYCPHKLWKVTIAKDALQKALLSSGIHAPADSLAIVARTPSGRALAPTQRNRAAFGILAAIRDRPVAWMGQNPERPISKSTTRARASSLKDAAVEMASGCARPARSEWPRKGGATKQILAFYYPGTVLGITAEGLSWQTLGGERVQVMSARPQEDQQLVELADRLARVAEERLGQPFPQPPKLKVYPTIAAFRDATGEPGWVAASTRGNVIRLQPVAALRARGSLDPTILHELLHALIESRANRQTPVWFSEGAVILSRGRPKAAIQR